MCLSVFAMQNYDHSKFNVAKTPIEKLAVIFGIDINDKEAMQKLQDQLNLIGHYLLRLKIAEPSSANQQQYQRR